ncbi:MAG: Dyp-type peroxidase [Paeniglutamicibacter sp.]
MPVTDTAHAKASRLPSRRGLLLGSAAAAVGAAAGFTAAGLPLGAAAAEPDQALHGSDTIAFHGQRQPGITTPAPAYATFLALDLIHEPGANEATTRDALARILKIISDDASRLMAGRGVLADTEPEMAANPARLTLTVGLGQHAAAILNPDLVPGWLKDLPRFSVDRLDKAWGQSDVLVQLCGDDQISLVHARRAIQKDLRTLAKTRWVQDGFRHSRGSMPEGATMRNLFGQKDGTGNPVDAMLDRAVFGGEGLEPWVAGGTSLVLRRIEMDLDAWDEVDRPARDFSLGRRQSDGSPLTGEHEFDTPDLRVRDAAGFPVISDDSHVARSQAREADEKILRRGYNYLDGTKAGLLFASYQCDVDRQFVPIQQRLDAADLLNEWTTPIGSAVYAILPGCREGSFLGKELLAT